jgi:hypothetical protein
LNAIQNAAMFAHTVAHRPFAMHGRRMMTAIASVVLLVLLGAFAGPSQAGLQTDHNANMDLFYEMHLRHLQHTSAGFAPGISAVPAGNMNSMSAPCPAWARMVSGDGEGTPDVLTSVAVISAMDVWAVGYTVVNQIARTHIQHWDGEAWTPVSSPSPFAEGTRLWGVAAIASNDVWAVGEGGPTNTPQAYVLHWDGNTWSRIQLPPLQVGGSSLYAITAVSTRDIWAVGYQGRITANPAGLIMHYNGEAWTEAFHSRAGHAEVLHGVSALSSDNVWAVGGAFTGRGALTVAKHWDGTQWSENFSTVVRLPRATILYSVDARAPDNIWAVGEHSSGPGLSEPLVEHWDGKTWSRIENLFGQSNMNALTGVAAISGNDIWAVGYGVTSDVYRAQILHGDGQGWGFVPSAADQGEQQILNDIAALPGGELIAVGATGGRAFGDRPLIEKYTDQCAPPLPTPTSIPAPTTGTPVAPTVAPTVPAVPIPGTATRTFPETGKTTSGLFLEYWDAHGGLSQQGYPISGMFGEVSDLNGQPYTVQYFERAVFEYHPENQPPFNVLLSQLGTFQYKRKYKDGAPNQQPNTSAGSVVFPETGKRVGGKFLAYWREHGGLAQQGLPISEEFVEKSDLDGKEYLVQYFERAVLEYHPENQPPFDVLLSQLGTFQYKRKYGNN